MKNCYKLLSLLLVLVLALGVLSACGGGSADQGDDLVIAGNGVSFNYLVLYGPDDLSKSFAMTFKDQINETGIVNIKFTSSATVINEANEIIFGESDRAASIKAAEYVNEKVAKAPQDFHWAMAYVDGKLAIVANNTMAYELAIEAFFANYVKDDSIVIKSKLYIYDTLTLADYEAYLEELERIEAEKKKEEMAKLLAEIKPLVESQREELKTYEGQISKYTEGDPMIKLFNQYTANIGNSSWGTVPYSITEEHPRLLITSSQIPAVKASIEKDTVFAQRFLEKLETVIEDNCILPDPTDKGLNPTVNTSNIHNYRDDYLEIIQAKALGYLVYGEELYGYQAIYYMKNYIKTLDIKQIASDQCRQYGYVMFTAALVYDWCYDLLTDVDKTQFISGVENCLCRGRNVIGGKMEVGFPPSGQGSVSGHGSEYQIMRDYLSFAIAIYDENASWWDYIGARVCNDYVQVRNHYFQSGIAQQGTGYATARHIADIYSAWLIKTATGTNPYVGMENTVRSFLGYEFKPGYIFNDGDGTGDSKTTSSFTAMAIICAYLYEDEGLLAAVNYYWGTSTAFGSGYSGISNSVYIALTGLCDLQPAENRYEGMELIQYNGYPLGQYIIRASWTDENSAAVFMRIKERSTGNHEHEDSGTFEIYYKGMLTSDGGAYNNYGHEHTQYFHQATISHNGLIIYNPGKSSSLGGWYSGGQRAFGESSNLNAWLNDSSYDTGTVTGRQHGYSDAEKTQPLYAYIAGDITAAYDQETVNYVGRRMLTVYTGDAEYPMVFFVYDDISSDNRNYEKRFLLQISSKNAPTIDTKKQTVITENEGGRLVLTCLSDDVQINGVGGRKTSGGAYDAKTSSNYLINGRQLVPMNGVADDGHWGRVEIVYDKATTNATFMNVMYVTDKGNDDMAKVNDTSSENGLTGAIFEKKIVALFATSRTGANSAISCKVNGSASMDYYVSGLAAGSWKVEVDGKTVGTFEATEEGGMLTFTASEGVVTITPAN